MGRSLSSGEAEKGVGGRGNGTDKAREAWRVSRHVRGWYDKAGRSMGSTWWEMRLGSQVEDIQPGLRTTPHSKRGWAEQGKLHVINIEGR